MKLIEIFIIYCLMFNTATGIDEVDLSDNKPDSVIFNQTIKTPEEALELALELTGFENYMKENILKSSAEDYVKKVVIEKDSTPFLNDQIEGRELWQIEINDVDLRHEYSISRGINYWRRKSFRILLDPNSGQIIKINSVPMVTDSICTLTLSADEETTYLKEKGKKYHGFPPRAPNISFRDALIAAVPCRLSIANEISAQYILYSKFGSEPKPVWKITSLGVPPLHFSSRGHVSSDEEVSLECYTCIVDAMTGKWESVSLVPCDPPEMSKKLK